MHSLRSLYLSLAVLVTVSVGPSSSAPHFSSHRTPPHHRFARRSFHPTPLQRRSNPSNDPSLSSSGGQVVDVPQLDGIYQFEQAYTPQSLEQEEALASQLWEDYVEAVDGEDINSYPDDCGDDEDLTGAGSPSGSSRSASYVPTSSEQQGRKLSKEVNEVSDQPSVSLNSNDDGKSPKEAGQHDAKRAQQAQVEAEAKRKQEAEAATENAASIAEKEQEASQAKKDQQAAQAKKDQQAADAQKAEEREAAQTKKDQEAAQAKKDQEAAQVKKDQEAAQAKKDQEADQAKKAEEAAEKANQGQAANQVIDLGKIPGTSVSVGVVHHSETHSSSYSSSSSEEYTGDATFYAPDQGACGDVNVSTDYIVAVSYRLYDSFFSPDANPNHNTICGRKINARYKGKTVTVTVKDRCEGCDIHSLDFTPTAFQQLAPLDVGRLHGMTWTWA